MKNLLFVIAAVVCSLLLSVFGMNEPIPSVPAETQTEPEVPVEKSLWTLRVPDSGEYTVLSEIEQVDFTEPDGFVALDRFVRSYFQAWEEGIPASAAKDVADKWDAIYGDRTFPYESFDSDAYLNTYIDGDGNYFYSLPFRFVQILWLQEDSCALEAVALGYKHLMEMTCEDGDWTVVKDIGCSEMHLGYAGEEKDAALAVYRRAAELLTAGLTEEDIRNAELAARQAFITRAVFFGPAVINNPELTDPILPILRTDYTPEMNVDRIVERTFGMLNFDRNVPLVIVHVTATQPFSISRVYEPAEIETYPSVVVGLKDGVWQSMGISISY